MQFTSVDKSPRHGQSEGSCNRFIYSRSVVRLRNQCVKDYKLTWIDKVKCLRHRDENLLVDSLGHAVLAHELRHRKLVL